MLQLPDGWSLPSVLRDEVVIDGAALHRAGLAATAPSGEEVTGSAAGASAGDVLARGWFELAERAATLEAIGSARPVLVRARDGAPQGERAPAEVFPTSPAPERWRFARSNGIALHESWETACDRALWELVERDRVLRAWYGERSPRAVPLDDTCVLAGATTYTWEAYAFDDDECAPAWSAGIVAAGVFGFPRRPGHPVVLGYAARPSLDAALVAAAGEAMQLLAFLWGEETSVDRPPLGPTPMHHLDRLLWTETTPVLRAWLGGRHRRWRHVRSRTPSPSAPRFADLTPAWLGGGLRIAKAITDELTPLTFGDAPLAAHLPIELRAHPVA